MYRAVYLFLLVALTAGQDKSLEESRIRMVEKQIIARGIKDISTINAMKKVPRHEFVPANKKAFAYNDSPLSIGYQQTISQPYIVAYMTEALKLQATDKVLEIGAGSGYQAAILGEIVAEVITIEIVKELAIQATNKISELGYKNIKVIYGDGYQGYQQSAPYDAIIVTAAPKRIPPPLIEQLKEGGRMIIPVGSNHITQYLILVEKINGKIKKKHLLPVRFVPFTGEFQN